MLKKEFQRNLGDSIHVLRTKKVGAVTKISFSSRRTTLSKN